MTEDLKQLEKENARLKDCPFCGGKATVQPERGRYQLCVKHQTYCFMFRMDGLNRASKMSATNWQILVKTWNRRKGD